MKFLSTRGQTPPTSLESAIELGLAPDGGLFVPEFFPQLSERNFNVGASHSQIANTLLAPFFADSPLLAPKLDEICKRTFTFPLPLEKIPAHPNDFFLELFHGPTCAFKDVGARFLANCVQALSPQKHQRVLVATSGDTGGAVAAAFFQKPRTDVLILFPDGKISKRQEAQLCGYGGNVQALAVQGDFDDCQRLVKEALGKPSKDFAYVSANSINLGRILPQMVYYAAAALARPGLNFIIPSGNLGNSLACVWAKKIGLPIGDIVLAFNANRFVPDYFEKAQEEQRPTIPTLANAMDVARPSNFERLKHLYPDLAQLKSVITAAESVSDDDIRDAIKNSEKNYGKAFCPHTATAVVVRERLHAPKNWALVATADPAKFETIVEPLIGHALPVPAALVKILSAPQHKQIIKPEYAALQPFLDRRPQ